LAKTLVVWRALQGLDEFIDDKNEKSKINWNTYTYQTKLGAIYDLAKKKSIT